MRGAGDLLDVQLAPQSVVLQVENTQILHFVAVGNLATRDGLLLDLHFLVQQCELVVSPDQLQTSEHMQTLA